MQINCAWLGAATSVQASWWRCIPPLLLMPSCLRCVSGRVFICAVSHRLAFSPNSLVDLTMVPPLPLRCSFIALKLQFAGPHLEAAAVLAAALLTCLGAYVLFREHDTGEQPCLPLLLILPLVCSEVEGKAPVRAAAVCWHDSPPTHPTAPHPPALQPLA